MKLYPGASKSSRIAVAVLVGLLGLVAAGGCRSGQALEPAKPIPAPTTRPVAVINRPALDLTRGGAGFPLDASQPPATAQELVDALTRAYSARLKNAAPLKISASGPAVQYLDRLVIDLSGSTVQDGFKPQPAPKEFNAMPYLQASRVSYIANPLHYMDYSASLTMEATEADMALFPGGDGKLSLMMTDCREGFARLRVGLEDLEKGLIAGAKLRKSAAFSLSDVALQLNSQDSRSLEADIVVNASVLLLPSAFRIGGRIDVDDDSNLYFTHLTATGLDPAGSIIAKVVQGKLDKLNNKALPFMRLPGDHVRVTDVNLSLDDALTVDVRFAGTR